MAREERNGLRKTRAQAAKHREPELGYYFVVTDTKETEENYLFGLRDSIPEKLRGKLVIKVIKTDTASLVDEAISMASRQSQYRELWIFFDRDKIQDFDKIISRAESKGIRVGWSNPCIEIWFYAYFGAMPTYQSSTSCCTGFAEKYEQATGQEYKKSDRKIYDKLCRFGDERQALKLANQKLAQHKRSCNCKPSEMCPGTTVYSLVEEIKSKIEK